MIVLPFPPRSHPPHPTLTLALPQPSDPRWHRLTRTQDSVGVYTYLIPLSCTSTTLSSNTDTPILVVNNRVYTRRRVSGEAQYWEQRHNTTTATYSSTRPPRPQAPLVIQDREPPPPPPAPREPRLQLPPTDEMCTTNVYTYVYPDGRKESVQQPSLCHHSRHGRPCSKNVVFQHPSQQVTLAGQQLPPTPTYTPRSSTPNYRSGDESDRSHRSSDSRKKRASGVYINGQKILDLDDRRSTRRERIVLVDNPPTPRTPPQTFTGPHTAPPSPNQQPYAAYMGAGSPPTHRPMFVDERPRVRIEVVDNHRGHERHSSTSSHESRHSYRSHSGEDEEERRRRRQRREDRQREEEEIRHQRMRARIAAANAEIGNRPAVPMPPTPKRAASFKRPVVEVVDHDAELVEAMRRLDMEQKARRAADKAERAEEEAQRQRLKERLMPRRRATVGPGSRRHRVAYDDGLYRLE
ncbi:hypothetical protein S7711_05142 [Stachybotrys chartarum IBT 7711]|uniref:Uncharacterized protein n=1 Tax=Stachybotrys chartarum (strain CBS 109288 / IBT 7711) TaxID=1280523 RepID=A0A084B4I8_STACB|nr:hypothetical protein S7711_05142 [Stachybotrys chartarum IBT 7711]